jgi:hypothetical protein
MGLHGKLAIVNDALLTPKFVPLIVTLTPPFVAAVDGVICDSVGWS